MEKKIDWSKAPEGTTHFCHDAIDGSHWRDLSGTYAKYWHSGKWHDHGFHSDAMLDGSLNLEARPVQPAWNGEGLPPVGTVCQVTKGHKHEFVKQFDGKRVRIVAHYGSEDETPLAVFRVLDETRKTEAHYHALVARCFEPIKTAEQIAAEAKAKAMAEMLTLYETGLVESQTDDVPAGIEALYDAGYRKQ